MATRLYVGARYVPKIVGTWSNGKEYEPLSVVNHNGNSYTSKISVPVGIDISNTDYWIQTGNYNAQVESLRATVNANTASVEQYRHDVSSIAEKTVNENKTALFIGMEPVVHGTCTNDKPVFENIGEILGFKNSFYSYVNLSAVYKYNSEFLFNNANEIVSRVSDRLSITNVFLILGEEEQEESYSYLIQLKSFLSLYFENAEFSIFYAPTFGLTQKIKSETLSMLSNPLNGWNYMGGNELCNIFMFCGSARQLTKQGCDNLVTGFVSSYRGVSHTFSYDCTELSSTLGFYLIVRGLEIMLVPLDERLSLTTDDLSGKNFVKFNKNFPSNKLSVIVTLEHYLPVLPSIEQKGNYPELAYLSYKRIPLGFSSDYESFIIPTTPIHSGDKFRLNYNQFNPIQISPFSDAFV